jgi:hypothetical protein
VKNFGPVIGRFLCPEEFSELDDEVPLTFYIFFFIKKLEIFNPKSRSFNQSKMNYGVQHSIAFFSLLELPFAAHIWCVEVCLKGKDEIEKKNIIHVAAVLLEN